MNVPPLPGITPGRRHSEAFSVNRYEHSVGTAQNNSGAWRAFRYRPGLDGMIDMNTLLPPGSLWVLTKAVAMDDAGIIVGFGTFNGFAKCWIMYPQCQN